MAKNDPSSENKKIKSELEQTHLSDLDSPLSTPPDSDTDNEDEKKIHTPISDENKATRLFNDIRELMKHAKIKDKLRGDINLKRFCQFLVEEKQVNVLNDITGPDKREAFALYAREYF